jgi:hypothetical protein
VDIAKNRKPHRSYNMLRSGAPVELAVDEYGFCYRIENPFRPGETSAG